MEPQKFYDADGNEVSGYTPEQFTQAIEAAKAAVVPPPAADHAPAPVNPPAPANANEPAPWAKEAIDKMNSFVEQQTAQIKERVATTLTTEQRAELDANFNKLTGFDQTPDGLSKRAEAAYLLTTGQPFNADAVNLQGLNSVNVGRVIPLNNTVTPGEKMLGDMMGITEEDRKKFASK
jgi:hypothetical protein